MSVSIQRMLVKIVLFAMAAMQLQLPDANASGVSPTIFHAHPGTNTLMDIRDTVRTWRANGHANSSAIILLSPGEYSLTETLTLDSRDSDTIWKAPAPDNTAILGGKYIGNLKTDSMGTWTAQVDFPFEQLYANGHRLTRNRLPSEGFFNVESVKEEAEPGGKARLTVHLPSTQTALLPANPEELRDAQLVVFHKWDVSRYRLTSADVHTGTFVTEGKPMQPWNVWDQQSRLFLDNCGISGQLAPGSWYLDAHNILSYRPRQNEEMKRSKIIAPINEKFLHVEEAKNVRLDGLRFQYSAYHLPAEGCPPAQAAATIGAAVEIDSSAGVTLTNCEIAHTGGYAVWFRRGCHRCSIEHSFLHDLGAGGIRIGEMTIRDSAEERTEGIVADNDIIRECGRVHPSAVGIWIGQSANNRITHNDISDTFYTAVSVGWTWGYGHSLATNNLIAFNRIHKIGQGALSDMGAVYTLGVSPGSACVGNVIFDVRAHDYGGWGIYPDEGSTGWSIESNLVWNCTCVSPHGGGAFHQHYGATNYIANNIFALSSGPPMQATRVENHLSFTLEKNIIIASNAEFFTGPWNKIQFQSRSNCFAYYGSPKSLFPNGNLAEWQSAGHEVGSILANLNFKGDWPNVTLSSANPAAPIGFRMFDTKQAGVYGKNAWKQLAAGPNSP